MTAPTPGEITAALSALRDDAAEFERGSTKLSVAAQAAQQLALNATCFSYVGDKVGITELYRGLQDKMVSLLQQGADNFNSVAIALRKSADAYEAEEKAGVHRMRNVY